MKQILNLNDYEIATGYNNLYFSLDEFINHYKNYYVNTRQKLTDNYNYHIVKNHGYDVTVLQLTFNDIFHDFISWVLYDLKIGKHEKISLIKYDDKIVIYTKNNKYEYCTFFDFN